MCCACDGGSENASPDCVPSHSSYSCDGGSFIVADGCADDTCSDCASTMDYTAWTGGEWYCDDTYFYQDVGGDGSFESMGPLMCYYDSCGGGDGGDDDDDGGDCFDTDNGATDPYGDGCGYYDAYPSDCGGYDDNDFSSDDMCCACDGGSENASPDCVPSHSSYSCDGGSFIVADGCADDTCSDCASTLDYTAWTGGEWYCDDTYFYQDVGGDGSFETMGPLMCYYDSCGGGDEDEEEVNSYAYDVVDYVGSYSYDGGMIDYGGSYSYGGDDDGGSYSYLFSSEGAPTPTAVPTGPSLSPTTLPTSEPTPLVVLSALATVSLAGFSCSDYTDAEATVLEQAMGDVITNLQSTEAIGCTSNRRLTDRDTQHLRYGRRLDDGASASIGMSMSALSHHTDSTTSSELAAEINDALASAASTGSLASAISSRASDAGLASLSSVSVSSVTVSTLSPTEQPTTFPSSSPTGRPTTPAPTPRPTGVYCTDGVLNGDETSIDCGGTCPACAFGESCGVDSDCASSACQGGVCITSPPTAAPTLACEDLEFTPPQLQEAKFSQTAGQLLLTWSLSTDRAGLGGASFDCDLLLDFPAVSYATCVWTSQQSLTVGKHTFVPIDLPSEVNPRRFWCRCCTGDPGLSCNLCPR